MQRFAEKGMATGLAAALTLGAGATALAYWTATGSGTGQAATTNGSGMTITQTSVVNDLEPGTTTPENLIGDLVVNNGSNAYVANIIPTVTGTSNPGCDASNFIVTPAVYDKEVVGSASGVLLGTIVFQDTTANQDVCKNVTVYISYATRN